MNSYIFLPTASHSALDFQPTPRFFLSIDGVMGNFTSHAAEYLDDLKLPYNPDGIFEEEMIQKHFAPDVLFDICNGREFWESMPVYPWSWSLFQRACELTKMDVYFLGMAYKTDVGIWGGKAAWVHKNYGKFGVERLVLSMKPDTLSMLCNGRQDILVSCIKSHVDLWNKVGGSALYFPELDIRFAGAASEMANRLIAMNDIVKQIECIKS